MLLRGAGEKRFAVLRSHFWCSAALQGLEENNNNKKYQKQIPQTQQRNDYTSSCLL